MIAFNFGVQILLLFKAQYNTHKLIKELDFEKLSEMGSKMSKILFLKQNIMFNPPSSVFGKKSEQKNV